MAVTRVVLPYAPRLAFMPYHARPQRFAVGVAHRRCGKTVACINDLVRYGLMLNREHPPGRLAYIGPQLNQSKDNVWQYLKHYAAPVMRGKNEQDLWVELLNGARVRLYGADNPDRIRGAYLDDVVLDEYADMHPGVWGTIVRPMLTDYRGRATFIGTPKGRNSFFEHYERARVNPDWFTFFLPASLTGILPEDELVAAREDMTPEQYEQEFECSFDAAILGAYYAREIAEAERAGRIRDVAHNPDLVTHTAWDLGHHDSTCIWFFQMCGRDIHVIDYYETHNHALSHYASVLAAKSYLYGSDFVPHDAKVAELGTGKTRIETLRELGRKPRLVPMHKVEDGINAVRVTFNRLWFDELKCRAGLEALRQYRVDYDDKKRAFKSTPRHDWCFVGQTKILTRYGMRRIMDLPRTGEVLTPCGWKPYCNPRITRRNAQLVEVAFSDGLMVRCTPDHLFATESGWKFAERLPKGLRIQSCLTLSHSISMAVYTGCGLAKGICRAAARNCTGMFGFPLSAWFRKAVTFITKIGTHLITPFQISNAWMLVSICRKQSGTTHERFLLRQERLPQNGIVRMRADSGISGTPRDQRVGTNGNGKTGLARLAQKYLARSFAKVVKVSGFAQIIAKPLHIESVTHLVETSDVWCLSVPDAEAFALSNGAVVHNCSHAADAMRYLVMAARDELQGPTPKPDTPKVLRVGRRNTVTFNDILDDRELRF